MRAARCLSVPLLPASSRASGAAPRAHAQRPRTVDQPAPPTPPAAALQLQERRALRGRVARQPQGRARRLLLPQRRHLRGGVGQWWACRALRGAALLEPARRQGRQQCPDVATRPSCCPVAPCRWQGGAMLRAGGQRAAPARATAVAQPPLPLLLPTAAGVMDGVGVRTFSSGRVQAGRWRGGQLELEMDLGACANAAEGEGLRWAGLVQRRLLVLRHKWRAPARRKERSGCLADVAPRPPRCALAHPARPLPRPFRRCRGGPGRQARTRGWRHLAGRCAAAGGAPATVGRAGQRAAQPHRHAAARLSERPACSRMTRPALLRRLDLEWS
jgi:hypothetical protein